MKKIFLFLTAIFISGFLYSQPVLQKVELPIGTQVPFSVGKAVNPGTAGANVIWDFSKIQASNGGVFERVVPGTTPYYDTFPTCNYVFKISSTITFYNYYNLNDSVFEWVGVRWGNGGVNVNLSPDPSVFVKFPLKYGDTIIDYTKATNGSDELDTIIYDGYGTLKTPFATYTNAVRIKTLSGGTEVYDWYVVSPGFFTYSIFQTIPSQNSSRIFNYKTTGITITRAIKVNIYPNPAKENITIETPAEGRLELFDVAGKLTLNQELQPGANNLSLTEVPAGVYFYKITFNTNEIVTDKLVLVK